MSAEAPGPVAPGERLETLDVLRGVAIGGIVLVNVRYFSTPLLSGADYDLDREFPGAVDRTIAWLVDVAAEGKFYPLLALLFGYGFSAMLRRSGAAAGSRWRRRVLGLALLGLAHAFLLWAGDVLVIYAVVGLFLLAFRSASDRALVGWAAVLLLEQAVLFAILGALFGGGTEGGIDPGPVLAAYGGDSASALFEQRATDATVSLLAGVFLAGPGFLAAALLGIWAERRGLARAPTAHARLLWRVFVGGLVAGGASSVAYAIAADSGDEVAGLASPLLVGGTIQSLAYAAGLVLLLRRHRLHALAPVGRAALSNYLLQSLVLTTIFYGYGLGLFGEVGPAPGAALALAVFALEVGLSVWWFRRFRLGPAEWALRSLTYARRQPLRAY